MSNTFKFVVTTHNTYDQVSTQTLRGSATSAHQFLKLCYEFFEEFDQDRDNLVKAYPDAETIAYICITPDRFGLAGGFASDFNFYVDDVERSDLFSKFLDVHGW